MRLRPSADVYHRRRDSVVLYDQQPLIRIETNKGGGALASQELITALERSAPAGATEIPWFS